MPQQQQQQHQHYLQTSWLVCFNGLVEWCTCSLNQKIIYFHLNILTMPCCKRSWFIKNVLSQLLVKEPTSLNAFVTASLNWVTLIIVKPYTMERNLSTCFKLSSKKLDPTHPLSTNSSGFMFQNTYRLLSQCLMEMAWKKDIFWISENSRVIFIFNTNFKKS